MLHLMKLSVGTRDVADLMAWQEARAVDQPPLRHRTRFRPKRAAEILEGGSIYWVIGGLMLVRQRVVDIIEDRWDDGSACAGIVLDPVLVAVETRPTQPFQGWRYLTADAAPADLAARSAKTAIDPDLPEHMRRQLQNLCLI
jgi:hypothetical protein